MPSTETKTYLALRTRLEALVLPRLMPVSWPNENFTKPVDGYLRVTLSPNVPERLSVAVSPQRWLGLFRVDVFARKNQKSEVGLEVAGLVADHFRTDTLMTYSDVTVRSYRPPYVGQPRDDEVHAMIPLSVYYEVFA